jgi:hypothetical protein
MKEEYNKDMERLRQKTNRKSGNKMSLKSNKK